MRIRILFLATSILLFGAIMTVPRIIEASKLSAATANSTNPVQGGQPEITVGESIRNDTSPPVREIDSTAQVTAYVPLARHDKELQRLIAEVINRQTMCILIDRYANAFSFGAKACPWGVNDKPPLLQSSANANGKSIHFVIPFDCHMLTGQ